MEEKDNAVDKVNDIYNKIEQNKKKYLDLMVDDELENAIKFNQNLNKRMEKLGIKTCQYVPKESDDGQN